MSTQPATFHQRLVKRLGKAKTARIEETVHKLVEHSIKVYKEQDKSQAPYINSYSKIIAPSINNADFCNAFGIMQGVAYAMGYKDCGACNVLDTPRGWFENIVQEEGKKAYEAHVATGTLATMEKY